MHPASTVVNDPTAAPSADGSDTAPPIWMDLFDTEMSLRWVDVNGISTRVLEAGRGPALVLSNGTSGHLECYARNVRDLARSFRVICYDSVGHGFTGKPDEPYTLPVYSAHLLGLLDALGVERAFLSGESLGSWISAWFAAEHPERVERLILNTPGNVAMDPEVMAKIATSTRESVADPSRERVRARLEWLFAPCNRHLVTDELVDVRRAIYGQPEFRQSVENILVLQDREVRERYQYAEEWCGRIQTPTLIIWTSDDPSGSVEDGELLASWIPGARFMVIEGAGHWLQWEKPKEFLASHLQFLLGEDA